MVTKTSICPSIKVPLIIARLIPRLERVDFSLHIVHLTQLAVHHNNVYVTFVSSTVERSLSKKVTAAYGGYTKPAYGAQGAEDSGGFVYGGSQQGSQGGGRVGQLPGSDPSDTVFVFFCDGI